MYVAVVIYEPSLKSSEKTGNNLPSTMVDFPIWKMWKSDISILPLVRLSGEF